MTYHVFHEQGVMLAETAAQDLSAVQDFRLVSFNVSKVPGTLTRVYQLLHILLRPFSLSLSRHFALLFNTRLVVPLRTLNQAAQGVQQGDIALFFNPSYASAAVVDALRQRTRHVSLYFLDPVHRLGLAAEQLAAWRTDCRLLTYSLSEARKHEMRFLEPYAPALTPASDAPTYDLVYVGSPSPKRLLWLLYLKLRVAVSGRRSYLRLASRHQLLTLLLPSIFCPRLSFAAYTDLCRRARGILELHERDADGVTLRATLCWALRRAHVCNLRTTPASVVIAPPWSGEFAAFLAAPAQGPAPLSGSAQSYDVFDQWLRRHFAPDGPVLEL